MIIGEAAIYFYPGGGHSHDGLNSSLIDMSAYSIFDFEWQPEGGSTPLRNELRNQRYNQGFIPAIRTEIFKILHKDAGIHIQPGSIAGGILIANSVTATELSADLVLIDNVIRSSNFDGTIAENGIITSTGTQGWAITYAGDSVFRQLSIDANNFWNANGFKLGGNTGIYTSGNQVRIGTDVVIEGNLTAAELAINANNFWNADGFELGGNTGIRTAGGIVRIGTDVIIEGTVATDEVVIDEDNYWDADSFSLNGENGVSTVPIGGIGQVVRLGSDIYINPNDGSIFSGSGAFQVQSNGDLFSNSGNIGGWTINSDNIGFASADGATIIKPISDYLTPFVYGGSTFARTELYWGMIEVSSNGAFGTTVTQITPASIVLDAITSRISLVGGNIDATGIISGAAIHSAGTVTSGGQIESGDKITSGGQIESDDMIRAGGTGVYYKAENLAGERFGIAFGWSNAAGRLTCVVNNDLYVRPFFIPSGFDSDRRLKENIQSITPDVLQKIYNTKIYEFDYKKDISSSWLRGKHSVGVMADELEVNFPEFVEAPQTPGGYYQVVYAKMIPHLLAAIVDLNKRLQALEQRLGYNS